MVKLPKPILDAIESAVKAGVGLAELPDVIRSAYIRDARELLAQGVSDSEIIGRFKEIAEGLGSLSAFDSTLYELADCVRPA